MYKYGKNMKSYKKYTGAALLFGVMCCTAHAQVPVMVLEVENENGEVEKHEYPLAEEPQAEFFGKNNVVDGDYITCQVMPFDKESQSVAFNVVSMPVLGNVECKRGLLLGTDSDLSLEKFDLQAELNDDAVRTKDFRFQYAPASQVGTYSLQNDGYTLKGTTSYAAGTVMYCRSYCQIDGVGTYYSPVCEFTFPHDVKSYGAKCADKGGLVACAGNRYACLDYDLNEVEDDIYRTFRTCDVVTARILANQWGKTHSADIENYLSNAEKVTCIDGDVYVCKIENKDVLDILTAIANGYEPFIANSLEQVNTDVDSNGRALYTTNCQPLSLKEVDPQYGVPGNQYISVEPSASAANPNLGINLDTYMLADKTYNITIRLAPDFELAPEERKGNRFYVRLYLPSSSAPTELLSTDNYRFVSSVEGDGSYFYTSADGVTSITVKYTPDRLLSRSMLQLQSQVTSKLADQYTRSIRFIDVKVEMATPNE